MHLTREEKERLVTGLAEQMDASPVVGILDMHSLPARQLQEIKKELVGEADITMARKTLIELALETSGREDIEDLMDNDAVQPALIFADKNPFSLFKLIQKKKSAAAASGGEIAPSDIVIEEGLTDLDPGPMLGKIQELGPGTSVEDGKIHIDSSAVVVEAGEVIDNETAEVLNALDMKPLEVGLDLKLVYEDGDVFDREVLEVDVDAYRSDIEAAVSGAFNLAVNAGYLTDATTPSIVATASSNARNLAINAGVLADDVAADIIRKAAGAAEGIDAAMDMGAVEQEESGGDLDQGADDGEGSEEDEDEDEAGEDAGDEDNDEPEETEDNDGTEVK